MASLNFAVRSDRVADQVLLVGSVSNHDGANNHTGSLPSGFGDCLLIEGGFNISNIATLAAIDNFAARVTMTESGGIITDVIDCAARIFQRSADAVCCRFNPDTLVAWKADESFAISFPEIDTNVAPAGDLEIYVKVRRIRQTRDPETTQRFRGIER